VRLHEGREGWIKLGVRKSSKLAIVTVPILCEWREALEAKRVLCGLFTCERPLPISPAAAGQVGGSVGLELSAGGAATVQAAGGCGLDGGISGS
jgi:hypothetical protein